MAESKNLQVTAYGNENAVKPDASSKIENIQQLNDHCLMLIMKNLGMIDLCAVAETCTRLKSLAGEVFRCKRGGDSYGIPQNDLAFKDHRRILKNFGHLVTSGSCITKFFDFGVNAKQTNTAFKWFKRYCADSLQKFTIIGFEEMVLPPSAVQLLAGMRRIDLMIQLSDRVVRNALLNCSKLVELNLTVYDGPFDFEDHRFPHLLKLSNRVRLNRQTNFNKIETFFRYHTKLTELSTQFLNYHGNHAVNLAFLRHLPDLKKLSFILVGAPVINIEAFGYLNNLQKFTVDGSSEQRTDALMLANLSSVDSLVKLVLGFPEISHLIAGIERFKNLSKLEISSFDMDPNDTFDNANISALAQLRDSPLTELVVGCLKMLAPESLVNVITTLTKLKTLQLECDIALTEKICQQLANVCSSQNRKLVIILDDGAIAETEFNFDYIENFNKKHGAFVEIIRKMVSVDIE